MKFHIPLDPAPPPPPLPAEQGNQFNEQQVHAYHEFLREFRNEHPVRVQLFGEVLNALLNPGENVFLPDPCGQLTDVETGRLLEILSVHWLGQTEEQRAKWLCAVVMPHVGQCPETGWCQLAVHMKETRHVPAFYEEFAKMFVPGFDPRGEVHEMFQALQVDDR